MFSLENVPKRSVSANVKKLFWWTNEWLVWKLKPPLFNEVKGLRVRFFGTLLSSSEWKVYCPIYTNVRHTFLFYKTVIKNYTTIFKRWSQSVGNSNLVPICCGFSHEENVPVFSQKFQFVEFSMKNRSSVSKPLPYAKISQKKTNGVFRKEKLKAFKWVQIWSIIFHEITTGSIPRI